MGQVSGLPEKQPGKYYLVSSMVLDASDRDDLLAPDTGSTAGRDAGGKITHVTRLVGKASVNRSVNKVASDIDQPPVMTDTNVKSAFRKISDKYTKGIYSDDTSWKPIQDIMREAKAVLPTFGLVNVDEDHNYPRKFKRWQCAGTFVTPDGKQRVVISWITAHGAGSIEDPLDKFDVTFTSNTVSPRTINTNDKKLFTYLGLNEDEPKVAGVLLKYEGKEAFNPEDTEDLRKHIYEQVRNNPGYRANKIEVTTRDKNGVFLKKLEERLRTKSTPPSPNKNLWEEGPDGYWYLQGAGDEYVAEFVGDKGYLVDRNGEKTEIPGLEIVDIKALSKESTMAKLSATLDTLASHLESIGMVKEAHDLDVVSNTIDRTATLEAIKQKAMDVLKKIPGSQLLDTTRAQAIVDEARKKDPRGTQSLIDDVMKTMQQTVAANPMVGLEAGDRDAALGSLLKGLTNPRVLIAVLSLLVSTGSAMGATPGAAPAGTAKQEQSNALVKRLQAQRAQDVLKKLQDQRQRNVEQQDSSKTIENQVNQ